MKKCLKNYSSKFTHKFWGLLSIACYSTTFSSCDMKGKVHENPDFSPKMYDDKKKEKICKDLSEKIKSTSTMDDLIDTWKRGLVLKDETGSITIGNCDVNDEVRDTLTKKIRNEKIKVGDKILGESINDSKSFYKFLEIKRIFHFCSLHEFNILLNDNFDFNWLFESDKIFSNNSDSLMGLLPLSFDGEKSYSLNISGVNNEDWAVSINNNIVQCKNESNYLKFLDFLFNLSGCKLVWNINLEVLSGGNIKVGDRNSISVFGGENTQRDCNRASLFWRINEKNSSNNKKITFISGNDNGSKKLGNGDPIYILGKKISKDLFGDSKNGIVSFISTVVGKNEGVSLSDDGCIYINGIKSEKIFD